MTKKYLENGEFDPTLIACSSCGEYVDPLALFPNDLCLDCYKQTPEANAPLTADGLTAMWTSPKLINL